MTARYIHGLRQLGPAVALYFTAIALVGFAIDGGIYAVLLAEGLTGAVAADFWWPISTVHVILFKILLGLISIHVAAALWHALYLRDATLSRIIPMRLFGRTG